MIVQSFRDGVILILSTGYSLGCATALILNMIIPNDGEEGGLPTVASGDDQLVASNLVEKTAGANVEESKEAVGSKAAIAVPITGTTA